MSLIRALKSGQVVAGVTLVRVRVGTTNPSGIALMNGKRESRPPIRLPFINPPHSVREEHAVDRKEFPGRARPIGLKGLAHRVQPAPYQSGV